MLSNVASSVTSLDISKEAVKISRDRLYSSIVCADARELPFDGNTFDALVSFEVFEHIANVELYAREAFRVLRNGGELIMSTPNVETYPMAGLNPYHVKEYSVTEVRDILTKAGFSTCRIFAQISRKKEITRLEKSKILTFIMRTKRRVGFHGDLLPQFLQRKVARIISGGDIDKYDSNNYEFIEGHEENPELIYILQK